MGFVLLGTACPTRQMRGSRGTDGSMRSEPMVDDEGNGALCQEAVDARDGLIERLCSIPPVPAALDFLLAHFGTDMVAEVTGRTRRIVVDGQGRQKVERRTSSRSDEHTSELQALMRISYAVFCLKTKKQLYKYVWA